MEEASRPSLPFGPLAMGLEGGKEEGGGASLG